MPAGCVPTVRSLARGAQAATQCVRAELRTIRHMHRNSARAPVPEFELDDLLQRFEPADSSALVVSENSRRFEAKRASNLEMIAAELTRLSEERSIVLAGTERIARYRTLYFDTPSRALY